MWLGNDFFSNLFDAVSYLLTFIFVGLDEEFWGPIFAPDRGHYNHFTQ